MLRSSNCGGTVSRGAEVDHVERAEGDDLRQPELAGRLQPVGAGGEHTADQLVRQLGRRQVEDAGEEAAARERLHRLPARAGGVEDEHLVAELLQPLARPGHAGRGHSEHRRADQRPPLAALRDGVFAIPAIAPAALERIRSEIRLRPEMSTTE